MRFYSKDAHLFLSSFQFNGAHPCGGAEPRATHLHDSEEANEPLSSAIYRSACNDNGCSGGAGKRLLKEMKVLGLGMGDALPFTRATTA